IGTGARRLRRVGIPTVTIQGDIALGLSFAFIIELLAELLVIVGGNNLVPVAVDILEVGGSLGLSLLSHESLDNIVVISDSRALRKRTPQINLQAPNAFLTGTEREGQIRAVAADVDIAAEGELVLDGELAAELRSCRNVRGEAQREDGSQGQSRKALHPCVSPSVSRVSRPSRWHPKGSPASGQCFLAD